MKHLSPPLAPLLFAMPTLLAIVAAPLHAEDVYVTSGRLNIINDCPPSCPYGLHSPYGASRVSTACTNDRNYCVIGSTNTAAWRVAPTLANSHGNYRIFVTKGNANDCSTDLIVNMTTTGGALADATGATQATVPSTAFQKSNSVNTWVLVGYLANNTNQPDVTFTYASGTINNTSRWYMDAVDFQSVDVNSNAARITRILHSNAVSIAGTGPVGHPFALVSSTNLADALDQWTPEQTNTEAAGTFSFSLTPGTAQARFFRVITQ